MRQFYRPEWTCGRYHKFKPNSYALFYNLIEGMAYFFENESADIVCQILQTPKNSLIPLQILCDLTNNEFSDEEILSFCNELVSAGLLTEGLLSIEIISRNRELIGLARKKKCNRG
jgi:hypothetical protein